MCLFFQPAPLLQWPNYFSDMALNFWKPKAIGPNACFAFSISAGYIFILTPEHKNMYFYFFWFIFGV